MNQEESEIEKLKDKLRKREEEQKHKKTIFKYKKQSKLPNEEDENGSLKIFDSQTLKQRKRSSKFIIDGEANEIQDIPKAEQIIRFQFIKFSGLVIVVLSSMLGFIDEVTDTMFCV